MPDDIRSLLRKATYRKVDIDYFLNPRIPYWTRFNPRLGYEPRSVLMRDGADGAWSQYTYGPRGHRKIINHPERPGRINTYGDSYTQSQQVSDGETWQEYLAANLGEPVRNFGVGGYSVYAAALRAKLVEAGPCSARYVILSIYDDDSLRNLDAMRNIRTSIHLPPLPPRRPKLLNGVPWPHVRINLVTGRFEERPTPCPTAASLRALCDPEIFYRRLKDDIIVHLTVLREGGRLGDGPLRDLERLAEILGIRVDLRNPRRRAAEAERLHMAYALKSTEFVVAGLQAWLRKRGKQFMVLFSYGPTRVGLAIRGRPRFDQGLLDFCRRRGIRHIDTLRKHLDHYRLFKLSPDEYIHRFFVPPGAAALCNHHNPLGNHFYAFSIKPEIVEWLHPKPPAYRCGAAGKPWR